MIILRYIQDNYAITQHKYVVILICKKAKLNKMKICDLHIIANSPNEMSLLNDDI